MSNIRICALLVSIGFFAAGCGQTQVGCDPVGDLNFVCGPINAEDLVLVPGSDYIVSSGMAAGAGFYVVDSTSGDWDSLDFSASHNAATYPNCSAPPDEADFESHGLHIRATSDDAAIMHVVGHGAREAIEVFEVDTGGSPELTWIGCVMMPEGLAANSVAGLSDGSFVTTVLFTPGTTFADAVVEKENTGAVYKWTPGDDEMMLLYGSELPANNGIEVSADGETIYVASSGYQTVVAFSNTNPVRFLGATRQLPITPDNVHLGSDGRLLTAGMKNDVPECGGPPGPEHSIEILSACPRGTIAIAIDPVTMEDEILVETPAVDAFSNATMVLTKDGEYWVGTFSGDKILHGPIP